MIDEAKDDTIGTANLNKLEMIENIDEATDEILKNLDVLRDGNQEWFQNLANNQKVGVLNQITLLRRQKNSNFMLSMLIEKADKTPNAVIGTQIADPLNNIRRVSNLYKRIPKGEFGLLQKGRTRQLFKDLANNKGKNGLNSSIDLSFQLLLGEGSSFHKGQSVFQNQSSYCENSFYKFFLQRISEGILLYETALVMDNLELPKTTRAAWAKYFALVGKVFSILVTYLAI